MQSFTRGCLTSLPIVYCDKKINLYNRMLVHVLKSGLKTFAELLLSTIMNLKETVFC